MAATDITGTYAGNDGALYYVRFVGTAQGGRLFWYGEHPSLAFSNVFVGDLNVDPLGSLYWADDTRWSDIPKGTNRGQGTDLELIISGNQIRRSMGEAGGFSGSIWNRVTQQPARTGPNLLAGFTETGLTGIWDCDDGGTYYIRQTGDRIYWFGEACSVPGEIPSFANVLSGTVANNNINAEWADVPYGKAASAGALGLRTTSNNQITYVSATGGFSGRNWTRRQITRNTPVNAIGIHISTATFDRADDLRDGQVAYGTVELSGGRSVARVNLNDGRGLQPGQYDNTDIALPAGTHLLDLSAFVLEHDGAPRNVLQTYDNWDVGTLRISVRLSQGGCPLTIKRYAGAPFKRLTGETTTVRVPLTVTV